ncbi:hypothetical protein ZIOFF_017165 [Zingiber officinale]|uniref:Peptidase M24 domain-containing protein n=1 Tax=Zingiber officinale TaxID=94328 RepID=A0A8J5HEE6_ZINOF|nr:hypothetical protein ZIOFF_017165 [Zingiber officinale]
MTTLLFVPFRLDAAENKIALPQIIKGNCVKHQELNRGTVYFVGIKSMLICFDLHDLRVPKSKWLVLDRRLEDGDIVNVDVTVYYKGIHGDLSETFFVGEVDEASRHLVHCTYECLEKAIFIVKPGIRFRDVEVFNRHATMSGLAVAWYQRVVSLCSEYSSLWEY